MPRNASGVYTLPSGTAAVSLTTISSTAYNNAMNDIAAALTQSVATTGVSTMTGALNMGSQKIINLAPPTLATDGATKGYIDSGSSLSSFGGFVNKIRNGTMDIWQRGNGPFAGGPIADGWLGGTTGSNVSWNRSAGRLLTYFALGVTGAAGNTAVTLLQRIESVMAVAMNGQQVTFQAQVYNGGSTPFTPQISAGHASATDNFTTVVSDFAPVNLQTCPPGQWTRVAYSWTLTTNAGYGIQLAFYFGAMPSTANIASITECDLRVTPGVPTGLVANPPPPELRPIGVELDFCQRYYFQRNYPVNTYYVGIKVPGGGLMEQIYFPVTMRALPTGAFSTTANWQYANAGGTPTALVAGAVGANDLNLGLVSFGAVDVDSVPRLYRNTAGASVTFSAEL